MLDLCKAHLDGWLQKRLTWIYKKTSHNLRPLNWKTPIMGVKSYTTVIYFISLNLSWSSLDHVFFPQNFLYVTNATWKTHTQVRSVTCLYELRRDLLGEKNQEPVQVWNRKILKVPKHAPLGCQPECQLQISWTDNWLAISVTRRALKDTSVYSCINALSHSAFDCHNQRSCFVIWHLLTTLSLNRATSLLEKHGKMNNFDESRHSLWCQFDEVDMADNPRSFPWKHDKSFKFVYVDSWRKPDLMISLNLLAVRTD